MNNQKRGNFSMVELMVVLVIVSIMAAMLMPMFDSMVTGSRVNTSARAITAELHLSREYALAKSRYVALIMPGKVTGLKLQYQYTCYRMAYVIKDGNDYKMYNEAGNQMSWVENSRWEFLPKGVAIMEADGDIGIRLNATTLRRTPYELNSEISLINNVDLSTPFGVPTPVNGVRAVVFSPSGKPRPGSISRFVTIGEAQFIGGPADTWVIMNPVPSEDTFLYPRNQSCANQLTIEINGFTGGVTYLTPDKYTPPPL